MIYLIDVEEVNFARTTGAKDKQERKKRSTVSNIQAAAQIGTGGLLLQQSVRSGVPRLLGVRLESHSTSKKNAKKILKDDNGYLKPGGKGAQQAFEALENDAMVGEMVRGKKAASKGKVFVTGVHPNKGEFLIDMPATDTTPAVKLPNNPILNVVARKSTRQGYRMSGEVDYSKTKDKISLIVEKNKAAMKTMIPGYSVTKGKSMYLGGSDNFFRKNFEADVDDPFAMMTDKPVKVYGNRAKAVSVAIKREGLGKLMKGNKGRVVAGALLLGVGGTTAVKRIKGGVDTIRSNRKNK